MEKKNITILKCSVTNKRITANYHNHLDDLNYEVEKDEPSHPDLGKAMGLLDGTIAEAIHAKKDASKHFKTKGFIIDEGDGNRTIVIEAGMTNLYDYAQTVKSGKIPFESEALVEKVDKIRDELFQYFFEDKCAQGILPGMQGRGLASNGGENQNNETEG